MFCPQCGSELNDQAQFCMHCGAQIEKTSAAPVGGNPSEAPAAKPATEESPLTGAQPNTGFVPPVGGAPQMAAAYAGAAAPKSNGHKWIWLGVALAAVVLGILIWVYIGVMHSPASSATSLEGKYVYLFDNDGYYEFTPNKQAFYDGTFEEKLYDDDEELFDEGTFVLKDDKVVLNGSYYQDDELIRYKDYLFSADYLLEGEVPDSDTFDAVCIFTDYQGNETQYTFRSDGTLRYEDKASATDLEGTYEREGEVISFQVGNSSFVYRLLVYQNRVTADAYYKR